MVMDVQFDEVFENVMMNAIIASCNGDGVLDGLAVSENGAGASMHVDVSAGNAWISGTKYTEAGITEDLAITAAHATLDRKDLVTYDPTTSAPIVTTGTAAATPEPPDIPAGDVLLAIVDVGAAVTQIVDVDITDGRVTLPSTYPPSDHSTDKLTSGTLPVTRGGTGVTGSGSVADVNATKVDGCDAGILNGNVFKLPPVALGHIYYTTGTGTLSLGPGTEGHQLTTHSTSGSPTWAAASDLIFSDTHCPKCSKEFQDGDNLILHVIGHNEVGDILTIPMHQSCATEPKKTVAIKRKVMEDQYILDELTGGLKVQRVQKMQENTVTKYKLKEGYVLDNKSGKALKIDKHGKHGKTKYNLSIALEAVEETISEVIYEDVEYEL